MILCPYRMHLPFVGFYFIKNGKRKTGFTQANSYNAEHLPQMRTDYNDWLGAQTQTMSRVS